MRRAGFCNNGDFGACARVLLVCDSHALGDSGLTMPDKKKGPLVS